VKVRNAQLGLRRQATPGTSTIRATRTQAEGVLTDRPLLWGMPYAQSGATTWAAPEMALLGQLSALLCLERQTGDGLRRAGQPRPGHALSRP